MMILSANNLKMYASEGSGFTTVNVPLSGEIKTDRGTFCADVVPNSADVTPGSMPFSLKSAAATTMVLCLDDSLLRKVAIRLTGCRQLRGLNFDGVLDLHSRRGRSFMHRANRTWSALCANELGEANKTRTVEDELACDFLLAANFAGKTAVNGQDDHLNTAAIRRVAERIRDQLTETFSRADLCEISGLHVRTLTRGFQLVYGVGPMQFLREQRLDAIRQLLLVGRPEETSVTRVAEDLGMGHLGRFAHAYKLRFGESPIDSLKR